MRRQLVCLHLIYLHVIGYIEAIRTNFISYIKNQYPDTKWRSVSVLWLGNNAKVEKLLSLYQVCLRMNSSVSVTRNSAAVGHGCFCYALMRSLPVAVYIVLVTGLRYHLFIWSVFSPKLLYEGVHVFITAAICLFFTAMDHNHSHKVQDWNKCAVHRSALQCPVRHWDRRRKIMALNYCAEFED